MEDEFEGRQQSVVGIDVGNLDVETLTGPLKHPARQNERGIAHRRASHVAVQAITHEFECRQNESWFTPDGLTNPLESWRTVGHLREAGEGEKNSWATLMW